MASPGWAQASLEEVQVQLPGQHRSCLVCSGQRNPVTGPSGSPLRVPGVGQSVECHPRRGLEHGAPGSVTLGGGTPVQGWGWTWTLAGAERHQVSSGWPQPFLLQCPLRGGHWKEAELQAPSVHYCPSGSQGKCELSISALPRHQGPTPPGSRCPARSLTQPHPSPLRRPQCPTHCLGVAVCFIKDPE